ncbi:MAG: taurine dioxygenase [Rhodospirillaceae bacterium]|nr:taurine dioxygenase [Rhodospirillaceae bacterium]HAA91750.1 taurine dioxygenase [Rhodospirillaceae bacterium]
MEIIPSGAPAGVEIAGIDIAEGIGEEDFAKIEAALNEHFIIVFRNQDITPDDQLAFAKRFGPVAPNVFADYHRHPTHPDILVNSNIKEDGAYIGNPNAGQTWHSDQSYTAKPPRATMLFAIEIPMRDGKALGDTLYASAAAAYDALEDDLKVRLEGLRAVHEIGARKRRGNATQRVTKSLGAKHPPMSHPIVRTHPFTGRKCLYVREGECTKIEGISDEEALPLIAELSNHIIREEFIYTHNWQAGDVVMWDNCGLQHLAIKDYEPQERRLLHRVVLKGEAPF